MDVNARNAVVVGVTGPGKETAALRFAAECARRGRTEVVIVHAVRTALPGPPPGALLTYADAADVAHGIAKEVEQEFARVSGGSVPFRSLALPGSPAHVLCEAGEGARMIVVQHRDSHVLRRLFVGSAAIGVAAHASCPVVSVPDGWTPAAGPLEVVVGVHEGGLPRPVLAEAFAWAADTGAPLRVVHAWRLDAAYDDIITARVAASWRAEQELAITVGLQELCEAHPEVAVTVEVRHQWPTEVLVDESQVASLVVVGRHGPHGWEPEHLGSLARTVMREAKCPVMVVPVRHHRDAPDDWHLLADEVSPQT